jgi:AcrR family transcriptional regulator
VGFRIWSIIGIVLPFESVSAASDPESHTPSGRLQRVDARRNRERVLAAAEQVFAEEGLKGQIEEVARRAGVGVGTVCRNFPTKQALVEAVLTSMYESLLARALEALEHPDPAEAFESFFVALPEFHARHRALGEQMAKELELPTRAEPLRERLAKALTDLVAHAQASGAIRDDIGPADVSLLFAGIAHATALAGEHQPMLRERYVRIILDGMRPREASALPGRPLDFAQLRRMKARRGK